MPDNERAENPAVEAIRQLRDETRDWVEHTLDRVELGADEVRILILAAQAFDESQAASEVLSASGMTYDDRWGCPRPRPEVAIARDARAAYAKLIGMLNLVETPDEPLPPTNGNGYGGQRR